MAIFHENRHFEARLGIEIGGYLYNNPMHSRPLFGRNRLPSRPAGCRHVPETYAYSGAARSRVGRGLSYGASPLIEGGSPLNVGAQGPILVRWSCWDGHWAVGSLTPSAS